MKIWITSGDRPSAGRIALQQAGGFRRLNHVKTVDHDYLINWGCSHLTGSLAVLKVINKPLAVGCAANKHAAFTAMTTDGVNCVPWTTMKDIAEQWLADFDVVVRNKLTGHSGDGIVILERGTAEVPNAPLYTKYINKAYEYRVHVVGGAVVDVQRKIRDPEREPTTWKVRSHANGFIFARNDVVLPSQAASLAVQATSACGLDFGAVDIILDKSGVAYVLEINTAPGLEGKTVESYVNSLKALCNGNQS